MLQNTNVQSVQQVEVGGTFRINPPSSLFATPRFIATPFSCFSLLLLWSNFLLLSIHGNYGTLIYTAPYAMLLMRENPLWGHVVGFWALEIETFLGPVKWHRRPLGECHLFFAVGFEASCKQMQILNTTSHRLNLVVLWWRICIIQVNIIPYSLTFIVLKGRKLCMKRRHLNFPNSWYFISKSFAALLRISNRPTFRRRNKIGYRIF